MLIPSSTGHQTNLFGTDLIQQLDPSDPLLGLAQVIPWQELDQTFARHYTQGLGRPAKPIRLMVGLLILKQLENLSDGQVVLSWKRNPYYQAFCGLTEFSNKLPCDSSELAHLPTGHKSESGLVRTVSIKSFSSVSGCTAKPPWRPRSILIPRFKKKTSPIPRTVNWRSKSLIA